MIRRVLRWVMPRPGIDRPVYYRFLAVCVAAAGWGWLIASGFSFVVLAVVLVPTAAVVVLSYRSVQDVNIAVAICFCSVVVMLIVAVAGHNEPSRRLPVLACSAYSHVNGSWWIHTNDGEYEVGPGTYGGTYYSRSDERAARWIVGNGNEDVITTVAGTVVSATIKGPGRCSEYDRSYPG